MVRRKPTQITPDEARKKLALETISEAVARKKMRYLPTWAEILKGQLRYLSPYWLGGQMLCMMALVGMIVYLNAQNVSTYIYLAVASATVAFAGVFLILELDRSDLFGMSELEQSCYLNLKQIWCIKILLYGGLDLILFTVLAVWIIPQMAEGYLRPFIYILVPFLAANVLYLFTFNLLPGRERIYLQMGAAMVCSVFAAVPAGFPAWYQIEYFSVWLVVFLSLAGLLGLEIKKILRELKKGERICWN